MCVCVCAFSFFLLCSFVDQIHSVAIPVLRENWTLYGRNVMVCRRCRQWSRAQIKNSNSLIKVKLLVLIASLCDFVAHAAESFWLGKLSEWEQHWEIPFHSVSRSVCVCVCLYESIAMKMIRTTVSYKCDVYTLGGLMLEHFYVVPK